VARRLTNSVTRREVLRSAAGLGVFALAQIAGATIGLRQTSAAPHQQLTMFVWSGGTLPAVAHEVARSYNESHPDVTIEVLEGQNYEIYPKMLSAYKLTPNQPLVHFGYQNVQWTTQGDRDGLWESLDPANVPNLKNILPAYRRPGDRGVAFCLSPVGLAYSTRFVKEPPTSWADLWNPRFKGKVTTIKYLWYYNGLVMAARMNGGSEKNIDPGFKLWSEHADQFAAFYNGNDDLRNMLVNGDAWLAAQDGANVEVWKQQGAPIEFVIPKEGGIAIPLYFVIVKGVTPAQKRIAEDVINVMLSDRWLSRWAAETYHAPTTIKNIAPPSLRGLSIFDPKEAARAIQLDWVTVAASDTMWRERWDKEVVAKMH